MITSYLMSFIPGPTWVKALAFLFVAAGMVLALFEFVFPWVAEDISFFGDPFDETAGDQTVDAE